MILYIIDKTLQFYTLFLTKIDLTIELYKII